MLARCSGLGCGGMVGLSCGMLGCVQLRILALPSDPVCSMLKANAMMGSGSGSGSMQVAGVVELL